MICIGQKVLNFKCQTYNHHKMRLDTFHCVNVKVEENFSKKISSSHRMASLTTADSKAVKYANWSPSNHPFHQHSAALIITVAYRIPMINDIFVYLLWCQTLCSFEDCRISTFLTFKFFKIKFNNFTVENSHVAKSYHSKFPKLLCTLQLNELKYSILILSHLFCFIRNNFRSPTQWCTMMFDLP